MSTNLEAVQLWVQHGMHSRRPHTQPLGPRPYSSDDSYESNSDSTVDTVTANCKVDNDDPCPDKPDDDGCIEEVVI